MNNIIKPLKFLNYIGRIELRMREIIELWETLVAATEKKGEKLKEASQQQQFNRTVEDIELWLSEIEGQLQSEDYGKVSFIFIYFIRKNFSIYFLCDFL